MGTLKIEADSINKRMLKDRVAELEKKVKLLDAVTANLVREVAAKEQIKKFMEQPEAAIENQSIITENP